ncbi:MAG: CDP-alcohol phosphatidyltransferase family protein [Candidatus Doudnabacteria bacterium]|nr:CDP-alcohol phosphatidyltransferase family protein [Candidatus Doudnabacteria bacterium]
MHRLLLWSDKTVKWEQGAAEWMMRSDWIKHHVRAGHITPNGLSYGRLVASTIINTHILTLFWQTGSFLFLSKSAVVVFPLYLFACITDMLDGAVARLYKEYFSDDERQHGINLDRHIDKLFTLPLLLFYWGSYAILNKYLILLSVLGDICATSLAIYAKRVECTIPSNNLGKAKMVSLCFCIGWIILGWSQNLLSVFLTVALTLGAVSLITNLKKAKRMKYPDIREFKTARN